jgi:anaphase-promoting complex subunit 3
MELFSTVLFHLSKEVDLAYLAHEMVDLDWLAPQTWCVIGNSFASQHEHDQAIACFQRAIQLDPRFAYAYSLQGLEHVENEEYDKARQCFMNALRANRRLYHAWLKSLGNHTNIQVWIRICGVQVWQKSSCN